MDWVGIFEAGRRAGEAGDWASIGCAVLFLIVAGVGLTLMWRGER